MQYSSYTNMRFVISFRPQKRESDVMTILKYFEPTIAVAQLQIKLNKKEKKSLRLEPFHIFSDFFTLILFIFTHIEHPPTHRYTLV